LVVRSNGQKGDAEIWRAFSAAPFANATVTATLSQSVGSSITLVSYTGVDTSGTNGSGAIGATATKNGLSGGPSASLVSTRAYSWVFGVGNDFSHAVNRTPDSGQTVLHQYLTPNDDTYWVQLANSATPLPGTTVTIDDTAPTADTWNLAIAEILPAPAGTLSISGTITPSSAGNGATVTLSGPLSRTATADSSGNYTFSSLPNGSYTVTPSKSGFVFSPASQPVTLNGTSAGGVNFTSAQTFSLSGTISPASVGNGSTVTLSGAANASTTADASGNYSFSALLNGSYTVTPTKAGAVFTPASQPVSINGSNATLVNFSGAVQTFSISGNVGTAAAGAALALSGTSTGTATADGSGNYTFSGVSNGSYTVTPTKAGFAFAPATQNITVSGANVTNVNFTPSQSFSLSGSISPSSVGAGATVTLTGASNASTTADPSGNFTITGLANGSYTVTPTKIGASFSPVSQPITINGANVSGTNFTATVQSFTISGSLGTNGANATVAVSGAATASTTADASGNYAISNHINGNYTVTPSKSGFTFSPAFQSVTVSGANVAGINFTAQILSSALAIDAKVFTNAPTASSTVTSPSFSTKASNELLLAFISADYLGGANTTVAGVTGGGLTWTLVQRTNVQSGTAEIWRAFAPSPL